MKRIYLDYAATTPVDSLVEKAMRPYFGQKFGNAESLHSFGQEASAAVFKSRGIIGGALGVAPTNGYKEIIFTGSATEANNLAIRGVVADLRRRYADQRGSFFRDNPRGVRDNQRPRLIVSGIEHESVLETCHDLEKDGVEVIYLPVSKEGIVDLVALKKSLNDRTVLVSIMYANNETGVIQPIAEIAKIIRNFRNSKHEARNPKQYLNSKSQIQKVSNFDIRISDFATTYPLLHTDAVQAFQYLDCDVQKLGVDPVRNSPPHRPYGRASAGEISNGVDLLTLSAHKIYGPKGIGMLYIKNSKHKARNSKQYQNSNDLNHKLSNSRLRPASDGQVEFRISNLSQLVSPIVTGGGQQNGLHSGTENVPYIVGFAKAVELVMKYRQREFIRVKKLRDYFWQRLQKIVPGVVLNGSAKERLPNNLNVYFPLIPQSGTGDSIRYANLEFSQSVQDLLIRLDLAGVAASAGSACRAHVASSSYVLEAMSFPTERCSNSLRFTLGRLTTKKEIDNTIDKLRKICYSQKR